MNGLRCGLLLIPFRQFGIRRHSLAKGLTKGHTTDYKRPQGCKLLIYRLLMLMTTGGGGLGPIHHHPQNQQPSGLDLRLPHQRGGGGVLIIVTVAISIGGGGYPGGVPLRKSACWPASLVPVWCITCA